MKKLRVWFNHWFSTAYHIINMMKENPFYELYVIGSNRNPDCVYQLVCDEFHTEPVNISDEEYVTFCLDFCKKHSPDVFVVRRGMDAINKRREEFEALGVRLLLEKSCEETEILHDKVRSYRFFEKELPEMIPEYYKVSSLEEFVHAYKKITENHERAIFKTANDEGATSFRVIDNSIDSKNILYYAPGMKITYDCAVKALSEYSFNAPLIVMPYLKGTEISVDCLRTENGNIMIPRYKSDSRIYTVRYDEKILGICRKISDMIGFEQPYNIQLRYDNDKPYLLEINTRMSGGIQLSCSAAGVNIPSVALSKLMGQNEKWSDEMKEKRVSYIETPVVIDQI